jgi:DNA-binding transcriptional LysR family regulator
MTVHVLRFAPTPVRGSRLRALEALLGDELAVITELPHTNAEAMDLIARQNPDAVVVDTNIGFDLAAIARATAGVIVRPRFEWQRNHRRELEEVFTGYEKQIPLGWAGAETEE